MKKACILWELCTYLVKFLRRQIYTSSGNICELFCSLINHIVGCYRTYGCMCVCCVRSRVVECELLLLIFHGSGEIYYSLPYVEIGLFPLGWLRNASAPTEAAVIFLEIDSLTSLTEMEPLLDPQKLEKENTHQFIWFSPGSQVEVHFPVVVVSSFLSGASFWLVFLINSLMELLMFHLTVCLEITFWKYYLSR